MAQPIHAFALADDDGHDVGCRAAGIDAEAAESRMKVIGVFPKLPAEFRLAHADFKRFERRRDDDGRQRTRINIGMRIKAQIFERLTRPRHKSSQRAERFRKRSVNKRNAIFHSKLLSRPAAILATGQHGMSFVYESTG